MHRLKHLIEKNKDWAARIKEEDPTFFSRLAEQQSPDYLWIGCSDSRVPANQIVGLLPGELFVHRNIANCVVHTDLNCLSVIFYAIQVLKVKHIIVTGHYGCGGVKAATTNTRFGLADHWIRNIRDIYHDHHDELNQIDDEEARVNRLCELNVIQQVANVAHIPAVQEAWAEGRELAIHGWVYDVRDGLIRNQLKPIDSLEQVEKEYQVNQRFSD